MFVSISEGLLFLFLLTLRYLVTTYRPRRLSSPNAQSIVLTIVSSELTSYAMI